MHKYIGIIAAAFSVLGAIFIALMFYAVFTNGSLIILVLISWFTICFIAALSLALISRFMAKHAALIPHGSTRFAMALSFVTLICLLLGFLFIG